MGGSQRRCGGAAEQEEGESPAREPAPSQGLWLPGGAQHPPVSSRFALEGGTEGRKAGTSVPCHPRSSSLTVGVNVGHHFGVLA